LGEVRGISGTVILGDGELAYVLDVHSLLKEDTGVKKSSYSIGM
jgi:chemotaxis protein histidine kinase CheA